MTSHVFKSNAYNVDFDSEKWHKTLVSQIESSIIWYVRKLDVEEVIFSCENVPLIGFKECISYNPTLALRQLEHPVLDKPDDRELEEMILLDIGAEKPPLLQKIIRVWHKVYVKGDELGRKNVVTKEPYTL